MVTIKPMITVRREGRSVMTDKNGRARKGKFRTSVHSVFSAGETTRAAGGSFQPRRRRFAGVTGSLPCPAGLLHRLQPG
jgi:hypothetical protein